MKRLLVLITLMALVLSLPLSVSADVVYYPEDDFLSYHMESCYGIDRHNRDFVANGPEGELTIYTSPENCLIQGVVPNREVIYISVVYTGPDGIEWGYVDVWSEGISGWAPMPYVVPVYDNYEFCEEFAHRLQEEIGVLPFSAGQKVYYWVYPGSENCSSKEMSVSKDAPEYDRIFIDDAGRKWGEIWRRYGLPRCWICLDDPSADYATLYATHPPQQVSKPDVQPKPEPETEPETTAPTEVEVTEPPTPETQPDTQPTTQPDTQPTTQPDTQPTTQPDTQPTTQPVSNDKIITPGGISPTTIVIAAVAVAAVSAGLLVVLKKKKS